jgi:protease-4
LLRNLLGTLRDLVLLPFEWRVPRDWILVRLDRGLGETAALPPWLALLRRGPPTLPQVVECLDRAVRDPAVHGVLLQLGQGPLGWSKVSSLARGIAELRAAGKTVVAYATSTGNAGAWLGSLADLFWMAPEGRLDLLGVRVSSQFVRGALDHLKLRADVLHAGRYKFTGEQLTRDSMSEPAREMLDALVEGLYESLVAGLAAGAAGDEETARRWIDEGPYLAGEARDLGLVHELVYGDELTARLARLAGAAEAQPEAKLLPAAGYLRVSRPRFRWSPLATGPRLVALVPLVGVIRSGSASPRGLVGVLRRLEKSDAVSAVVLRVDCPGGDALASDLIWRAVGKLAEAKPVVASLGDTAASGGYYAAMAAHEILAEPTTLTGSIGVAMPWIEIDDFLERFGVRIDAVERGRHAGIYDVTRARSQEERALLRRQVERLYQAFVEKAARARGLEPAALERVAQGRVWTGEQAAERGLVDALGGVGLALERARALAGLRPDEGEVVHVAPVPQGLLQRLGPEPPDLLARALWCPIEIPLR